MQLRSQGTQEPFSQVSVKPDSPRLPGEASSRDSAGRPQPWRSRGSAHRPTRAQDARHFWLPVLPRPLQPAPSRSARLHCGPTESRSIGHLKGVGVSDRWSEVGCRPEDDLEQATNLSHRLQNTSSEQLYKGRVNYCCTGWTGFFGGTRVVSSSDDRDFALNLVYDTGNGNLFHERMASHRVLPGGCFHVLGPILPTGAGREIKSLSRMENVWWQRSRSVRREIPSAHS